MLNNKKYGSFKRTLISPSKLVKIAKKDNVYIYDNRVKEEFKKGHFRFSINVRHNKLQKAILKRKKRDRIILLGYEERTNASLASWARSNGYKKVYLIEKGLNNIDKNWLLKEDEQNKST